MSRSRHNKLLGNREYWSRRPCKLMFPDWGRISKKFTHRAERQQGKNEVVKKWRDEPI